MNIKAREERHAKLREKKPLFAPKPSRNSSFRLSAWVTEGRKRIFNGENDSALVSQLFRRVVALTLGFLLVIPFLSSYQLTQGAYIGVLNSDEESDGFSGESAPTLGQVVTADGFLLKPSLNTVQGDRTAFSDIFVYTVEDGDTLSSVAERFGLKKDTILSENNVASPNRLKVGTQLRILPVDGLSHEVAKGDTLEKVAKKYKVDKKLIAKQNQLEEGAIEEGMVLIVPGAKREEPVYVAKNTPGTAPSFAPANSGAKSVGRLIWPVGAGRVLTQPYHRGHTALDIAYGHGQQSAIYAAAAGKVIRAEYGWNGGYGNVVMIDHGNGMVTLYGHNEKLYVTKGEYVEQGQTIGFMGHSGNVRGKTGNHSHFEVRINGVKYDPRNYF